jgi:hypothetical protein
MQSSPRPLLHGTLANPPGVCKQDPEAIVKLVLSLLFPLEQLFMGVTTRVEGRLSPHRGRETPTQEEYETSTQKAENPTQEENEKPTRRSGNPTQEIKRTLTPDTKALFFSLPREENERNTKAITMGKGRRVLSDLDACRGMSCAGSEQRSK